VLAKPPSSETCRSDDELAVGLFLISCKVHRDFLGNGSRAPYSGWARAALFRNGH
jgi:hypothetical protein